MITEIHCPYTRPEFLTDTENVDIDKRVKDNIACVNDSTLAMTGTDRLAARHFFSQMFWLEQIATMAAAAGEAVEGQYVDEIVHRESFSSVAHYFGGLFPVGDEVNALLKYINEQEEVIRFGALNLYGEHWLDSVFERVGEWGLADGLFSSIEEDEERHHSGSSGEHSLMEKYRNLDKDTLENVTRNLEKLLSDIMSAPHFSFPMIYFGGEYESAMVGLDICDAHDHICEELGIESKTDAMRTGCRAQKLYSAKTPTVDDMNGWEKSKMNLWEHPAEMSGWFECPLASSNPVLIQLDLMKAVSTILFKYPELNRVVRNSSIYRLNQNVVGQRFSYDMDHVSTIFIADAWKSDKKSLLKRVNRKVKKTQAKSFSPVPYMKDIVNILPPSRCAVVINYNGFFGHCVKGPLNDIEGVPIQLMIGEIYNRDGNSYATVTVTMDHRVGDGKDISGLGYHICEEMKCIK